MNAYLESFLRKDIYPDAQQGHWVKGKFYKDIDVVFEVYENEPKERHYIDLVIEDYIKGTNAYMTRRRLLQHIICPFLRCRKMESERMKQLDEMVNSEDYNRKVAEFVAGARAMDGA